MYYSSRNEMAQVHTCREIWFSMTKQHMQIKLHVYEGYAVNMVAWLLCRSMTLAMLLNTMQLLFGVLLPASIKESHKSLWLIVRTIFSWLRKNETLGCLSLSGPVGDRRALLQLVQGGVHGASLLSIWRLSTRMRRPAGRQGKPKFDTRTTQLLTCVCITRSHEWRIELDKACHFIYKKRWLRWGKFFGSLACHLHFLNM